VGSVYEAGDGLAAIEVLRTRKVGLVLSDINIPNMDGLELLGRIKASEEWRNHPLRSVEERHGQPLFLLLRHAQDVRSGSQEVHGWGALATNKWTNA
jgi:CheY-like chemotaxis protein